MANKTLFSSIKSKLLRTDATNEAGGRGYEARVGPGDTILSLSERLAK